MMIRKEPLAHPSPKGFTLIELLTVIAIIGILAAILIPVVGRVRESARTARCTSNLREVSQATLLYAEENDDRLPAVWSGGWDDYWVISLAPYTGVEGFTQVDTLSLEKSRGDTIFWCPAAVAKHAGDMAPNESFITTSYGLNRFITSHSNVPESQRFRRTWVKDKTLVLLGGDGSWQNDHYRPWIDNDGGSDADELHGGRANLVFLDGHVESFRWEDVPSNNSQFWRGPEYTGP